MGRPRCRTRRQRETIFPVVYGAAMGILEAGKERKRKDDWTHFVFSRRLLLKPNALYLGRIDSDNLRRVSLVRIFLA